MTSTLLPPALTPGALLFMLLATLVAGLARGFSGFGGALIFMPLASIVIEPKLASAVLLIADGFAALSLIPNATRHARKRDALVMGTGALVGVPLGTAVLVHVEPITLRWGISLTVIALLLLLVSGWRYRGEAKSWLSVSVGFVSGLFSGAAQLGGPPVVAYFLGRQMPSSTIRASIILYFAVSTLISTAAYGLSGLLTLHSAVLAALTAPVYSLGLFCGSRLFGLASERVFRNVCYGLILTAAVVGLPVIDGWLR